MKKGIELEYFTIDHEGNLADADEITDELEFAAPEFAKCITEIKSEPCDSIEELREDVKEKVGKATEKADEKGLKLAPVGTPLNHTDVELIESERLWMMKKFNPDDIRVEKELARTGLHIHFEKRNVKDQLNILTALDPASALINSSPYHKGENEASSCRNWVYRYSWEPKFPDSVKLWDYADSVQEWKDRMHSAFDDFKEGALEAGVEEETFNNHYHRDRSIWTPIRLRDQFPTVEYRSPDTCLPSQAIKLAEDMEKILKKSQDKEVKIGQELEVNEKIMHLPKFEKLEKLSRIAAIEGLESQKLNDYLAKFSINPDDYRPLTEDLKKDQEISLEEARKARVKASEMLEEDVEDM